MIFQLVALIEPRFPARPVTQSRTYWLLPCVFWLSTTAQVFNSLIHPTGGVVVRGGKTIVIADVYESCASAALFTIIFTGITALVRLYSRASRDRPVTPSWPIPPQWISNITIWKRRGAARVVFYTRH